MVGFPHFAKSILEKKNPSKKTCFLKRIFHKKKLKKIAQNSSQLFTT
jgi:hypothetical protein